MSCTRDILLARLVVCTVPGDLGRVADFAHMSAWLDGDILRHIRDVFTIPPLRIFARGAQLHVPILVGSNEFRAYPVNSDSDVPPQYRQLESDTFAYGALSIARATTQARQKAYLYCFTYADTGHRAPLGAHHAEELFFLSDTYPSDWQPRRPDRELAKLVRGYWCSSQAT
jgi:hypothetical protein